LVLLHFQSHRQQPERDNKNGPAKTRERHIPSTLKRMSGEQMTHSISALSISAVSTSDYPRCRPCTNHLHTVPSNWRHRWKSGL